MKVFWNVSYRLRYVQGWGFSLGGLSVSLRFTLDLFNVGEMFT